MSRERATTHCNDDRRSSSTSTRTKRPSRTAKTTTGRRAPSRGWGPVRPHRAFRGCWGAFEVNMSEPEGRVYSPPQQTRNARGPQARKRLGCGLRGRLFLGYFFLAKQKEVTRLSGRDPTPKASANSKQKQKTKNKKPSPQGNTIFSIVLLDMPPKLGTTTECRPAPPATMMTICSGVSR